VLDTCPDGTVTPPEGSTAEPNMLIPVVVCVEGVVTVEEVMGATLGAG